MRSSADDLSGDVECVGIVVGGHVGRPAIRSAVDTTPIGCCGTCRAGRCGHAQPTGRVPTPARNARSEPTSAGDFISQFSQASPVNPRLLPDRAGPDRSGRRPGVAVSLPFSLVPAGYGSLGSLADGRRARSRSEAWAVGAAMAAYRDRFAAPVAPRTARPWPTHPVVLVHRFGHNDGAWSTLGARLGAAGFFEFTPVTYGLDDEVPRIAAYRRSGQLDRRVAVGRARAPDRSQSRWRSDPLLARRARWSPARRYGGDIGRCSLSRHDLDRLPFLNACA